MGDKDPKSKSKRIAAVANRKRDDGSKPKRATEDPATKNTLHQKKTLDDDTNRQYYAGINSGQKNTLADIFFEPIKAGITWEAVESLFQALGAEITEGSGSRVRIALNGTKGLYHRPHPENTIDKGALKSVRDQLRNAGVLP